MHHDPTFLQILWFVLIAILWIGFFVLEGFDFGVGVLLRFVGRDSAQRRTVIHTIGPVWDGNEVWLITAGGATFAAFPGWYASLFSGFYLALFLVLAALIIRGVSFEFWGKEDHPRWRASWEWAAGISSFLAALLFGVAWADIIHGVGIDAAHNVTATLWDLLHPYALLGGLVTLSLFIAHGAGFLTLRTRGELTVRARVAARVAGPVSVVLLAAFVVWTAVDHPGSTKPVGLAIAIVAVLAALGSVAASARRRDGLAFALSCATIALLFASLFAYLYPNALPSSSDPAFDLTLSAASSSHYTQVVMTVVAAIFLPIVLAYQAWTYWVFRHRLGGDDFSGPATPIAVLEDRFGPAGRVGHEGEGR